MSFSWKLWIWTSSCFYFDVIYARAYKCYRKWNLCLWNALSLIFLFVTDALVTIYQRTNPLRQILKVKTCSMLCTVVTLSTYMVEIWSKHMVLEHIRINPILLARKLEHNLSTELKHRMYPMFPNLVCIWEAQSVPTLQLCQQFPWSTWNRCLKQLTHLTLYNIHCSDIKIRCLRKQNFPELKVYVVIKSDKR